MSLQSLSDAPKDDLGIAVRLLLWDGRTVAGYFNRDRRAWCWVNGYAGICWILEAEESRNIQGWAPLPPIEVPA